MMVGDRALKGEHTFSCVAEHLSNSSQQRITMDGRHMPTVAH